MLEQESETGRRLTSSRHCVGFPAQRDECRYPETTLQCCQSSSSNSCERSPPMGLSAAGPELDSPTLSSNTAGCESPAPRLGKVETLSYRQTTVKTKQPLSSVNVNTKINLDEKEELQPSSFAADDNNDGAANSTVNCCSTKIPNERTLVQNHPAVVASHDQILPGRKQFSSFLDPKDEVLKMRRSSTSVMRRKHSRRRSVARRRSIPNGCIQWSTKHSTNVLISPDGSCCFPEPSEAMNMILSQNKEHQSRTSCYTVPILGMGNTGWIDGIISWTVLIERQETCRKGNYSFAIGVAEEQLDHLTLAGSMLLWSNGTLSSSTHRAHQHHEHYSHLLSLPCHVTVHVHRPRREVLYAIDGLHLGRAFTFSAQIGVLLPVVVFSSTNVKATIRSSSHV